MNQKIQPHNPKMAIKSIIDFAGRNGTHRDPIVLVVGDRLKSEVLAFFRELLSLMSIGDKLRNFTNSAELGDYLAHETHYDPLCYWHNESPLSTTMQKSLGIRFADTRFRHFAPTLTIIVMKGSPINELNREVLHPALMACINHRVVDISPTMAAWTRLTNLFTAVILRTAKKDKREVTIDPEVEVLLTEGLRNTQSDDENEIVRLAKRCYSAALMEGLSRISKEILIRCMPERYSNALKVPQMATVQ
ncbi:MAG: hypothetical protein WCK01_05270 [Candidatus Uhrbacteria bacterium]